MNVTLSILQVLLALHTALGAIWKTDNSEKSMPSLGAIPHGVWVALSIPELICGIALVLPLFDKRFALAAPVAAGLVAVEMFFFSGMALASGTAAAGSIVYWLVVAAIAAFIVYGRLVLKPMRRGIA